MNVSNQTGNFASAITQRSLTQNTSSNSQTGSSSQAWGNISNSSNSLSALLALVTQLIAQLKQAPQQQPQNKNNTNCDRNGNNKQEDSKDKETSSKKPSGRQIDGRNLIQGTRRDDDLTDSAGDDLLRGRSGDDRLTSSSGNDSLRGGRGDDTAIISGGDLADYGVSKASQNTLKISHNTADHSVLIKRDVETIRFNDQAVSWKELRDSTQVKPEPPVTDPEPELLTLDAPTRSAIQNHFGIFGEQNFDVIDSDKSKSLSVGDVVSVSGGVVGGQIREIEISQADLDAINSDTKLELSPNQQDALAYRFNDTSPLAFDGLATEFTGTARDINGDNALSAGDIVELRKYGGNGIPPTDFVENYSLTAEDVAAINNFANQGKVTLNDEQTQRLQQAVLRQDVAYIPGDGPRLDSVIDKDGNGELSVGDAIKIVNTSGFETGNPTIRVSFEPLTQEQFDRYEAGIPYNPSMQQLILDDSQTSNLAKIFSVIPSTITVADNNSDGLLSAGDTLGAKVPNFSGGAPSPTLDESQLRPVEFTLNKDHAQHANGEFGEPIPFTSEQRRLITNTLNLTNSSLGEEIPGIMSEALDKDGSAKLSVGDVITTKPDVATGGGNPLVVISLGYHRLSADDINALDQAGIPVDPVTTTPPTSEFGESVSGGGVTVGGNNYLTGEPIDDAQIVTINDQSYPVGFLKTLVDDFAAAFNPEIVDAAFGVFPWGTSNSLAAGNAFQEFVATNYPDGGPAID